MRNGTPVGTTTIGSDGSWSAAVPAPPHDRRLTAHYGAKSGATHALALKLTRRMSIASVRVNAETVRVSGRISGALGRRRQPVVLKRQTACGTFVRLRSVKLGADGRYSATVRRPAGLHAAVFRTDGRALTRPGGRTVATHSLPTPVALE